LEPAFDKLFNQDLFSDAIFPSLFAELAVKLAIRVVSETAPFKPIIGNHR